MDSYNRQALHNGPLSPERVTQTYAPQRSASTSAVDAPWPQDQHYNTSYSTSSYMESRSYGDKRSNKPPPSPTMQRSVQPAPAPAPAPAPIPARTSSKEYMRTRSNSSSSNWQQQQQQQTVQQQRPLQRQQSDTLYDRNRDVEHIMPRSYGSNQSTPPHSPRAVSPVVGLCFNLRNFTNLPTHFNIGNFTNSPTTLVTSYIYKKKNISKKLFFV